MYDQSSHIISSEDQVSFFKETIFSYMQEAYEQEIAHLVNVYDFLRARAESALNREQLAIILDIDETSVSNWPIISQFDDWRSCFLGDSSSIIAHIEQHRFIEMPSAIKPIAELYIYAKKLGIEVFFISGRPASYNHITLQQLLQLGFYDVTLDHLICKSDEEMQHKIPNSIWKPQKRAALHQAGYTIILNIGDQESDIIGGYAEKAIKLPNKFYVC